MSQEAQTAGSPTPSLYGLKSVFVQALEPIRKLLHERDVAPTTVTMTAIPVEVTVAVLLVLGPSEPWLLALIPPLTLCWMALNALDGSLARSTGRVTAGGAVINELVDRLGDLLLIAAAVFVVPIPLAAALAVAVLGSELVAAIGWATTGRRSFTGPMGKPDRAVVVAIAAVATVAWSHALSAGFGVIALGSAVGIGGRVHSVLAYARSLDAGDAP